MSALGEVVADEVGQLFHSDFQRFRSEDGVLGLAREDGGRLDILMILEIHPVIGIRRFLEQCKGQYTTICIWEANNLGLGKRLLECGFSDAIDLIHGELVSGYRWDAEWLRGAQL